MLRILLSRCFWGSVRLFYCYIIITSHSNYMSKFVERVLYGRGFNFAAQINPTRKIVPEFTEIAEMGHAKIKKLGCGYLQSYYLLQDGRFVKAGYFMDSLTSIRLINMHRLAPYAIPFMQKLFFLGKILSFRGGDEIPTVFNRNIEQPFTDMTFGGCRVFGICRVGEVYAMGENYFAQLGTKNIENFEHAFTRIAPIENERITAVGCGFQHTLFTTDSNNLYGCGKASEYQIQPLSFKTNQDITDKIDTPEAIIKGEKIRKATGGLKFSLIWTDDNKLFSMGDNRFGQCGQNNILQPEVKSLQEIQFEWDNDERILDIACGFCHSLVLTNKFVYFFGSIEQGQNPYARYNENICTLTPLPIKDPVKIFADFDRSAIISSSGELHIFGGRDYSYCGGESGKLEIIPGMSEHSLVGLGFSHTLLYP